MGRKLLHGALGLILVYASAASATETVTYRYDAQGRVVGVDRTGSVNNGETAGIDYDNAGNRENYASADGTTAQLSISDAIVTEGATLSFTVTRSGVTSSAASASYATSNGTATAGSDYTATSGTVSFATGEVTKTITVNTTNDTTVEPTETMTVTLSSPSSGASIVRATGTGAINDNDTTDVTFSISDASANEGANAVFTVTKTGTHSGSRTVDYATTRGTGPLAKGYTPTSGTLSFTSAQTSKTITVTTLNDSVIDPDETFGVVLSNPSGGSTIVDSLGIGTIHNTDTLITLTDASLNVLAGQTSTYSCSITYPMPGITVKSCSVISPAKVIYYYYNYYGSISESFNTGYSMVSGQLSVLSDYYGM